MYQEAAAMSRTTGQTSTPVREKENRGLRDILVHVDNREPCPARVQAAISLAVAHRAHLIGLYVIVDSHIPSSVKVQISGDVLEAQTEATREQAARAETMFREQAEKAGVASEWLCEKGDRIDILSEQARFFDVAVIGQRDPDAIEIGGPSNMPDHVVLSAGRPVLVVPHVGTYPTVGKRVMVAWDRSLPAARAVNDALPILRGAESVKVVTVYRHDVSADAGREPGERICRHLARHGVAARSQHFRANGIGTGDLILSRAADESADLIVMGAYGHARWRELVLGGVTLHMLKHMTVPVLMSH